MNDDVALAAFQKFLGIRPLPREAREFELALHLIPGTISEKLKAIADLIPPLLFEIEKRYAAPLKKAWGEEWRDGWQRENSVEMLREKSLVARHQHFNWKLEETTPKNHRLFTAYFGLLELYGKARDKFEQANIKLQARLGPLEYDRVFVEVVADEQLRDSIVPYFFTLQLHCHALIQYLFSMPGDGLMRLVRSSNATAGRVSGKDVFQGLVLDCLNAHVKEGPFKNLAAMFRRLDSSLTRVLAAYQAARAENGYGYGGDLKPENLERAIREWVDEPEFEEVIQQLVPSRRKRGLSAG